MLKLNRKYIIMINLARRPNTFIILWTISYFILVKMMSNILNQVLRSRLVSEDPTDLEIYTFLYKVFFDYD
jgi:hypothetical protein